MITIEIEEFSPKTGEEYTVSNYPHEGFFIGQAFGQTQLIVVQGFNVGFVAMTPATIVGLREQATPKPVEMAPPPQPVVNGITEATFLKALAMAHGTKVGPFTI